MKQVIVIAVNDEIHLDSFPFLEGQRVDGIFGHEVFIDRAGQDLTTEQEEWLNSHPGVEGWMEADDEEQ